MNVRHRWAQLVSSHCGRTFTWTEIHSEYLGANACLNFLLKALSQNGCRRKGRCLIRNFCCSFDHYVFVVAFVFARVAFIVFPFVCAFECAHMRLFFVFCLCFCVCTCFWLLICLCFCGCLCCVASVFVTSPKTGLISIIVNSKLNRSVFMLCLLVNS